VHVSQLNQLLAPHGIVVRSQGGGYRIRVSPPQGGRNGQRPALAE